VFVFEAKLMEFRKWEQSSSLRLIISLSALFYLLAHKLNQHLYK